MPDTPFEFLTDTDVAAAHGARFDADALVLSGGGYGNFCLQTDLRTAVTEVLLRETHTITA